MPAFEKEEHLIKTLIQPLIQPLLFIEYLNLKGTHKDKQVQLL